jgi:hypothetical protein
MGSAKDLDTAKAEFKAAWDIAGTLIAAEPSLHCDVQPCGPEKDQLTFAGGLSVRSYRGSGSCSFTDRRRHGAAGSDGTKARDQLHDLAGRHFRPWRREDVEFDGG